MPVFIVFGRGVGCVCHRTSADLVFNRIQADLSIIIITFLIFNGNRFDGFSETEVRGRLRAFLFGENDGKIQNKNKKYINLVDLRFKPLILKNFFA